MQWQAWRLREVDLPLERADDKWMDARHRREPEYDSSISTDIAGQGMMNAASVCVLKS